LPRHAEEEKDLLTNIIKTINDTYGVNLTNEDKVDIENIQAKLETNEDLLSVMTRHNTPENIRYKVNKVVDDLLLDFVHGKLDLYKKMTDPRVNKFFKRKWFDGYYKAHMR